MAEESKLLPMPEDWTKALAVAAHPDDLEYGAASAIARWTSQGKEVVYLLVTRGEAGISSMSPKIVGPLREEEERRSAAAVGVDVVEFLDHPDGGYRVRTCPPPRHLPRHTEAPPRSHHCTQLPPHLGWLFLQFCRPSLLLPGNPGRRSRRRQSLDFSGTAG